MGFSSDPRDFPDFVVPSFRIHPWWAGAAVGDGDGRELRELLEQIPTAGVGHLGDRKHVFFGEI